MKTARGGEGDLRASRLALAFAFLDRSSFGLVLDLVLSSACTSGEMSFSGSLSRMSSRLVSLREGFSSGEERMSLLGARNCRLGLSGLRRGLGMRRSLGFSV